MVMMEKQAIKIELEKKQVAVKKGRKNYFMIMMADTLNMYADMNRISGTCRGRSHLATKEEAGVKWKSNWRRFSRWRRQRLHRCIRWSRHFHGRELFHHRA
jgi:hypothetical protein